MPDDYRSAAERHYRDAEMLAGEGRYDNAGHLIGFAGECAIKAAVVDYLGGTPDHQHFPDLLNSARKRFGSKRDGGMRPALAAVQFAGWSAGRRYHATNGVDEATYSHWRTDARRLLGAASVKFG